jgi:fibronectin-binding autotransporter adhesin
MKPLRARLALSTIVLASCLSQPLSAATFTWDTVVDGTAVTGGAGTWNAGVTGTPNWTQDAGVTNVNWPDTGTDNDAVFGGTGGTVAIASGGVVANDLSFSVANYIVSGNSLTLNGTTNVITTSATATISSSLIGTTGFSKSGAALLTLNGDNSGLSGTITLPNVTGTNNAGLSLSGANSFGGISQIDINGTSGTDGQFLALANVTFGSGVTLNLSGQGGNAAPVGTLRAVSAPAVVNGPVNLLTGNVRISSSGAGSEMRVNGKISDGVNSFPVSFRFADGNGVYLTNTANDWGGDAILGAGILRAEPGAVPATTKISIGGSGNGWFQTNGTLTRPLGTTSGTGAIDLSNSTASRIIGLAARGGALSVNLGGAASDIVWGSTTGFNPSILGLNNSTSDSVLTLVNPLDLNGANRVIQVDANTASLTGGLKNSSATAAGLRKLGAGTLSHDPGSSSTLTLQSLQTGAGTLEVKSGTITVSSGAATTYSAGMNGFTVVGGSTFRLSGGTVNAKAANYVFTAGHTSTGGTGNFILDSGTFDAGGAEILNAYGTTGTSTINGGTFICGPFRVGQGNGTLNLNGGILRASNLSSGGSTTTVNFNGGTLQAKAASTGFVPTALTNAVVRVGGAVIDSNGFNVTISHALTEDSGSTGGGLTKKGTGILDLTGINTYTGTNLIQGGTLRISDNTQLGASTAPVTIDGGQFGVSGTAITSLSSLGRTFTYNTGGFYVTDVTNVLDVDIALTASAVLSKSGSGTIKLSGANTFTGGITMGSGDNGWIEVDNAADLGTGAKVANLASSSGSSIGGFRLLNNVTVTGVDLNLAGRNVNAATQHAILNVSGKQYMDR